MFSLNESSSRILRRVVELVARRASSSFHSSRVLLYVELLLEKKVPDDAPVQD